MTTSFPTRRSSALPLHEGRHDGTAEESTVPYVFACMCAMSKLERYAAKDQCKEQSHDRHIEDRQHDGIGHGEEDHQPTAAEHQPCLVAVPNGRDGIHHRRAGCVIGREGKENAHPEIKADEHDIDKTAESDKARSNEEKEDHRRHNNKIPSSDEHKNVE